MPAALPAEFYARPVLDVARSLVGCVVRHGRGSGRIVETEAYHDTEPASHAFAGLTPRTQTLFGPPGIAYVYRSYGIHALLNAVCEDERTGAGVLIRALEPLTGERAMRARRGRDRLEDLCSGPGKLTQALGIGLERNGTSLVDGPVRIEAPAADAPAPRDHHRSAHRDHARGRPALALLRGRQPLRVAPVAAGSARRALSPTAR